MHKIEEVQNFLAPFRHSFILKISDQGVKFDSPGYY